MSGETEAQLKDAPASVMTPRPHPARSGVLTWPALAAEASSARCGGERQSVRSRRGWVACGPARPETELHRGSAGAASRDPLGSLFTRK